MKRDERFKWQVADTAKYTTGQAYRKVKYYAPPNPELFEKAIEAGVEMLQMDPESLIRPDRGGF